MLSQVEDEVLTDRLKNWGRAIADHKVTRTSPLYWLRVSAAIADGNRSPGVPCIYDIDYQDADIIQRAWRVLPERPERYRKAKRILVLWYACPQLTRKMVAHHLHIPDKKLDIFLSQGKVLLFDTLERQKAQELANSLDNYSR